MLGFLHCLDARFGWWDDRETALGKARSYKDKALELEHEQARLRYTTTKNIEAWTNWVQGLSHYRVSATKENMGSARLYWEKALALDPTSAALNERRRVQDIKRPVTGAGAL
jgi:hypothetical protein